MSGASASSYSSGLSSIASPSTESHADPTPTLSGSDISGRSRANTPTDSDHTSSTTVSVPSALPQSSAAQPSETVSKESQSKPDSFAAEVVRLTNIERQKNGLPLLKSGNIYLQNAADIRVGEIKMSFSHTRPDGSQFYTAIDTSKVSYTAAGENIASGQRTPEQVVNAWMNSSGHRENILNPSFNYIAVGYSSYNWVQLFARI